MDRDILHVGRHADTSCESSNLTDMYNELALSNHKFKPGVSALFCENCEDPIPEARRKALESIGGTQFCALCAK